MTWHSVCPRIIHRFKQSPSILLFSRLNFALIARVRATVGKWNGMHRRKTRAGPMKVREGRSDGRGKKEGACQRAVGGKSGL
jgi:hypothetical protein